MKKKIINILYYFFIEKIGSPTRREIELINELQNNISNVKQTQNISGLTDSEKIWIEFTNDLKKQILSNDPRRFLEWKIIQKTMFIAYAPYIHKELRTLQKSALWKKRWKNAIKESLFGHPLPYIFYPKSSANLIHHAYHLMLYEEKINIDLQDFDCILEFGGGYGSMCRLFFNINFKGKYIIYDLPYFTKLQEYYLKNLNLPLLSLDDFNTKDSGILCISDLKSLEKVLFNLTNNKNLFIATWFFSETALHFRDSFSKVLLNFKNFLIAYNIYFGEVDNSIYFDEFYKSFENIKWLEFKNPSIDKSYYLFGKQKQKKY